MTLVIHVSPEERETVSALSFHVDGNKIAQVVRNLVSNALKFTARGGSVEVSVTTVLERDEEGEEHKMLRLSVKDSGAGISEVRTRGYEMR